ncbi:hypothetical protein NERG_01750 [Nematocida ausubeli]|uniref:Uncharacterized protein n=1 Tax=Nematocida ausubeli (strain ATCC PRA-371 / ERTm2) TaxID=1913371 RepID=H8ZDS9_NEMA1|nr:hypothetical protein NERG_01750 [Nematocida ausubeli]
MNMRMKRKTQECLYERKNKEQANRSTKSMSMRLLAKVLLMCMLLSIQNVFGLLNRKDMEEVLEEVLSKTKDASTSKMNLSFSPILLDLYREIDILYKRRFNSPYITSQFSVSEKKNILQNIDRTNQKVKEKDAQGNEMPKETVDHYNALISMFPSPSGEVSIYPKEGCKDSFTSFLKSKHVKEYAHRILAALLIRAEGVPVPLIIENEESECPKLTWTNEYKPEESFSVPICIASAEGQGSNGSNEEANIKKVNSRLLQTIKYFINAKSSQELEESIALKESTEKEVYWENVFTETPAWLIQSYIYYYLETKEEAIKLYGEIDKKLKSCIDLYPVYNYSYIAGDFFDKSFTSKDVQSEELVWWEKVKKLEDMVEAKKEVQLHPFADNSHLPNKAIVNLNIQGNTYLETKVISSDIESVLLTLLCCFVYDPETNTYNVNQILGAKEEVKSLFGMPSKSIGTSSNLSKVNRNSATSSAPSKDMPVIRIGQEIPQEVWSRWSEIVQNVVKNDEDISYIILENNRCMIKPDIFNILIIMIKVTGIHYSNYKNVIQVYKDRKKNITLINNAHLINPLANEIANYAAYVFSCICGGFLCDITFPEWCKMPSKDKKERRICVNFINCAIKNIGAGNDLTGSIEIYYATENSARPIIIHFAAPEKAHLEIGSYAVKSNNSIISNLKKEICTMPKNSYSLYALSKYAETLELYTPDDVVIDKFYIEEVNNHAIRLENKTIQPWQYANCTEYGIPSSMISDIFKNGMNEKYEYDSQDLKSLILSKPGLNIKQMMYLIVCIAKEANDLENSFYNEWEMNRRMIDCCDRYTDDCALSFVVLLLKHLIDLNADLDIANVVELYARVYGHSNRKCLNTLFNMLSFKKIDTAKIIKCLEKYGSIIEK